MNNTRELRFDEANLCPQCRRQATLRHLGKNQYYTCDACRIFEPIGYNLFTPYEELVYNGVFDDVIGGAGNRDLAVVENDLMVTRILEQYREISLGPLYLPTLEHR